LIYVLALRGKTKDTNCAPDPPDLAPSGRFANLAV
jgi:hypothetical protein